MQGLAAIRPFSSHFWWKSKKKPRVERNIDGIWYLTPSANWRVWLLYSVVEMAIITVYSPVKAPSIEHCHIPKHKLTRDTVMNVSFVQTEGIKPVLNLKLGLSQTVINPPFSKNVMHTCPFLRMQRIWHSGFSFGHSIIFFSSNNWRMVLGVATTFM